MTGKLKKSRAPDRDRIDEAKLRRVGEPAHINAIEDRLLSKLMPESHGKVMRGGLLAEAGQEADDRVTLLTPKEQKLLALLGGSGAVNPETGLLAFGDGDGTGTAGGGGGVGGDNGVSGPGGPGGGPGGPSGGPGPGGGASPGGGFSFSSSTGDFGPPGSYDRGVGAPGFSGGPTNSADRTFGWDGRSYYSGPLTPESIMNTPSGYRAAGYGGIDIGRWAKPDTWGRLAQTMVYGPPPSYKARGAVPGRFGAPNGLGPGIVGTALGRMVGGPFSAAMALGTKFDQAMSPATRAASLAENQAQGTKNSTGQDRGSLNSPAAGSASGARTSGTGGLLGDGTAQGAASSTISPDGISPPTAVPGTVVDTGGRSGSNTLTGLPPLAQNWLLDHILRGDKSSGWIW